MLPPEKLARLQHARLAAETAGLCIVPPREDGSKQPDTATWTQFQRRRPTAQELTAWYGAGRRTGLGLICGAISGQLELFEFDDRLISARYLAAAEDAGLGPLVARIRAGYEEVTPGDGIHWLYVVGSGGTKTEALARRMGVDKHGKPCALPLIETKGEGGYVVVAPSFGHVHPSGHDYILVSGGFSSITTITLDERDALWSLARSFDELPQSPPRDESRTPDGKWELRPGDDFNARATWADLLTDAGWEAVRETGETTLWRRPGGYEGGWGASTNHDGHDLLHVFTTAASPLKPDTTYTKFTAFATIHHGGNFAEAAASLEAQGYGKRRPKQASNTSSSWSSSSAVLPDPPPPLVPVMPFPVDALPEVARRFVVAGAHALGCPPDFVALPLFAFVGSVAGNSRKLRLKHRFLIAPIFWIGVIGKPGTAKTPALELSRGVVDILQKASWTIYEAKLATWQETEAKERGPHPRVEDFFATDTTAEAIAFSLQRSRGLTVIHDELVGWVLGFDAYKKSGGDRQTWLSLWSGQPLKPNRKTGEPIYIQDPVVCVTGGIQPVVLAQLAGEAAKDDGFITRLLLGWPDAEPAPWTEEVVSDQILNDLAKVVVRLRVTQTEPTVTALSDGAYGEFVAWYNENRLLTGAATGLAAGWAAKAPVHLGRIALVLHLLAHGEEPARRLSVETMRDAILIVEYFRDQLRRILPIFGSIPHVGDAGLRSRIRRILASALPAWITRADLSVRLGGHHPSAVVEAELSALADRGEAERRRVTTSGRPREEWRWAPDHQPSGDASSRAYAPPKANEPSTEDGDAEKSLVRENVKSREKPPEDPFSRFHVFPHDDVSEHQPEVEDPWVSWEVEL